MPRLKAKDKDGWSLRLSVPDTRVTSIELIVGIDGIDVEDDNVDVSIEMADGTIHNRVFITPKNIMTLLDRWCLTGECGHGSFLTIADSVVVHSLSEDAITTAVIALLEENEFDK